MEIEIPAFDSIPEPFIRFLGGYSAKPGAWASILSRPLVTSAANNREKIKEAKARATTSALSTPLFGVQFSAMVARPSKLGMREHL